MYYVDVSVAFDKEVIYHNPCGVANETYGSYSDLDWLSWPRVRTFQPQEMQHTE